MNFLPFSTLSAFSRRHTNNLNSPDKVILFFDSSNFSDEFDVPFFWVTWPFLFACSCHWILTWDPQDQFSYEIFITCRESNVGQEKSFVRFMLNFLYVRIFYRNFLLWKIQHRFFHVTISRLKYQNSLDNLNCLTPHQPIKMRTCHTLMPSHGIKQFMKCLWPSNFNCEHFP